MEVTDENLFSVYSCNSRIVGCGRRYLLRLGSDSDKRQQGGHDSQVHTSSCRRISSRSGQQRLCSDSCVQSVHDSCGLGSLIVGCQKLTVGWLRPLPSASPSGGGNKGRQRAPFIHARSAEKFNR